MENDTLKRNDTYVSAAEPTPAAPARPAPTSIETVSAQWRSNFGAGLGVTLLVAALYAMMRAVMYLLGVFAQPSLIEAGWVAFFSICLGVAYFAYLMWLRGSIDEFEESRKQNRMIETYETMVATLEKRDAEIARLNEQLTNALMNNESLIVRLQQANRNNSGGDFVPAMKAAGYAIDPDVYQDAVRLLRQATRGQPYSKYAICGDGKKKLPLWPDWTQERWKAAYALLVDAKIVQVDSVNKKSTLLVSREEVALSKLDLWAEDQSVGTSVN